MDEVVYAIWDFAWGEHLFLYEIGEADDGFYCRCVDADSGETLALGLGDSPTEAHNRAERAAYTSREDGVSPIWTIFVRWAAISGADFIENAFGANFVGDPFQATRE